MSSPANQLQEAIDKLEGLKAASVPGPWFWEEPSTEEWPTGDQNLMGAPTNGKDYPTTVLDGWGYDASGIEAEPADRELIVTLHRTLDAQIAILRTGLDVEVGNIPGRAGDAVALARAVLGVTEKETEGTK